MNKLPRMTATLSQPVLHQLKVYALCATAAGVGALSLAQPAEGRIIYTPAHKMVPLNRTIPIDLNGDGIHELGLVNMTHNTTTPFGDFLAASPLNSGDGIWAQATSRGFNNYASALPAGARIGGPSTQGRFRGGRNIMAFWSFRGGTGSVSGGPWKNVRKRFLGVKFLIKGKVHYGWARLNVTVPHGNVSAVLTGFAYETIANKPIIAGQTKSDSTLGRLALGR